MQWERERHREVNVKKGVGERNTGELAELGKIDIWKEIYLVIRVGQLQSNRESGKYVKGEVYFKMLPKKGRIQ